MLSSLKAEKEREKLNECTFAPWVNPNSTKLANTAKRFHFYL